MVRNYYDAQGQKTISLHPGTTSTEEVFHAGALTLRADGSSYATTKHIYAGGQRLASKMDHRWFTDDPVQYYATDHLGSTNFTFDSEGNVLSHTEYFPSGEIWRSETLASHSGINQYQFTGKEWDDITGLYDFGFRSYDPVVGQWLSPDPAFDGLNLYAYVHNNPVNMVDPFGLSAVRGEDSQTTWSNRTLDDNGVTSHFEDGEFHDPYRDDSGVQAPSYDDFRQQAYEDARNQQRAEAYIKSNENADWHELRNQPIDVEDTSGTWRAGMEGVMLLAPTGGGAASAGRYVWRGAVAQRAAYNTVVRNLDDLGRRMLESGATSEQVARLLVPLRNAAKENICAAGPAILKWSAEARNLLKYGNKLGPTADQLRKAKGSWEAVIEGVGRTNAQLNRLLGGG